MALATDILAELVQRRHDCLSELLSLTRQQYELASAGDLDGLLAVLDRKRPLLESLQRISRAMKPFSEEDPDQRSWSQAESRAACQRLWNDCDVMYRQIVGLEQTSQSILCQRRDQIALRIDTSHWAQAIHAAYLQDTAPLAQDAGNQLDLREQ
jgi:hypothetical protein